MINLYTRYSPRANPPDSNYPLGSIKNESVPGADDGTPLEKDWGNNIEGFHQALLADAGIIANGVPDKVGSSQLLEALKLSALGGSIKKFKTVALMKASTSLNVNDIAITAEYYDSTLKGGSIYIIKPNGFVVPDGYINHSLPNSNIAVLQVNGPLEIDQCGAKSDDMSFDNLPVFMAAMAWFGSVYPSGKLIYGSGVYRYTGSYRIKESVKHIGQGGAGFKLSGIPANHLGTKATILYADFSVYEQWAITTDNKVVASGLSVPYEKVITFTENDAGSYTACINVEIQDMSVMTNKSVYGGVNIQMSPNSRTSSLSVVGFDVGMQRNCCWGYDDSQLFVVANYVALARPWCNGGNSSGYLTVYAQTGGSTKVFSRNYPFADISNAGTAAYPLSAARATTCDYISNSGCEGSVDLICEHSEYAAQYIKSNVTFAGQVERTLNKNGFLCDDSDLNIIRIGLFQVIPFSNIQKSFVTCSSVRTSDDVWRTVDDVSVVNILNFIGYGNKQQPHNSVILGGALSLRFASSNYTNLLQNTEVIKDLTGWTGDGARVTKNPLYGSGIALVMGAGTKTAVQSVFINLPNGSPMVFSAAVNTGGVTSGSVSIIIALHKAGAYIGNAQYVIPNGSKMSRFQVAIESFGDADEVRCAFSSTGTSGAYDPIATKFQLENTTGQGYLRAGNYMFKP